MKETFTPQRDDLSGHRSKESRLKKNQKVVAKRSLTFASGTEELSSETGKELSEISPSSETGESTVTTYTPPVSSEAYSDLKNSANSGDLVNTSIERCVFRKIDGSVEVDIVSSFLKQARNQVVNSRDVDEQSKKLLDALLKVVLDECCALTDEEDFCTDIVSARGLILCLCILFWSFTLSVIFFFRLLSDRSGYGPLPT